MPEGKMGVPEYPRTHPSHTMGIKVTIGFTYIIHVIQVSTPVTDLLMNVPAC